MNNIPLIKPYISYSEIEESFKSIFESGWFTKGKFISDFRKAICDYTKSDYTFCTTSATTALYACLKCLGIGTGDEVIVADFSFPASANVVEEVGATSILVDVSLDTFNMLPDELENKINDRTKAVIFVDAFGNLSGIQKIKSICKAHALPLIEDAACAIGSSIEGIQSGNISDFSCFSFHPRKLLTCGEGGAITTNNSRYASRLEILLNHGAKVTDNQFDFVEAGFNFRMTELQSAMGIAQLQKLDEITKNRNLIKNKYNSLLEPLGFKSQKIDRNVFHNVQSLVYIVPPTIKRDDLITFLNAKGIESTLGTYCLSSLSYYSSKYNNICKNSYFLQKNTITLPCFENVNVNYIYSEILNFLNQ